MGKGLGWGGCVRPDMLEMVEGRRQMYGRACLNEAGCNELLNTVGEIHVYDSAISLMLFDNTAHSVSECKIQGSHSNANDDYHLLQ